MQAAPTWIDRWMAELWRGGDRGRHYTGADRWLIYPDESCTAFMVLATNGEQSWIGGDDTSYSAFEAAAAVERWSTTCCGLNDCLEFVDALHRGIQHAEAKGTRLEVLRAKYLLDAMLARVAIAHAEDAKPFTGYAVHKPFDDAETATLIVRWEADDDSPA